MNFQEMKISPEVLRSLEEMGFESATPIQVEAIPTALEGKDIIGQAQTGTGKTAAFGIPLLENVNSQSDQIQALVLAPTRELAVQVAEEIHKIGRYKGVRSLPIYGGQDIGRQIRALKNRPQIIIATPGRLMDHLRRKTIRLEGLRFVVLDEADEMLDMGFLEDIESILEQCPPDRQTMLFSATISPSIRTLSGRFLKQDRVQVTVKTKELTVTNIEQEYYEIQERQKLDVLTRLLDIHNPELAVVFGRTKRRVDELTSALQTRGYLADGLHGDLSQNQRDAVMRKFREGTIEILVATDVAARGLDITGITHVYNFDVPQDVDSYVHRIGRTGRAGKSGIASTFVTPREMGQLHQIERTTKRNMVKRQPPTLIEAVEGKQRIAANRLEQAIESKNESESFRLFHNVAADLLDRYDSIDVVAAALQLMTRDTNEVPINLTEEQPLRSRRSDGPKSSNNRSRNTRGYGGKGGSSSGGGYAGKGGKEGGGNKYGTGSYGGGKSGGSQNRKSGYSKRSRETVY